jgi:hypothetical protein
MRDVGNVSNLKEDFNVNGHVFEEFRIWIGDEIKKRTDEGNQCYYSLQQTLKCRTESIILKIKKLSNNL